MKTIDVRDQPTLSLRRTFEICVNGIRYRLFRSAVTVVVIVVAIAFMMNIVCEAISLRSVAAAAQQRTAEQRLAMWWVSRLSTAGALELILQQIAAENTGSLFIREAQQFGQLSDADMARYHPRAQQAAMYLAFFDNIGYSRRRMLVGHDIGTGLFDQLQSAERQAVFKQRLHQMKTIHLPTTCPEFFDFLTAWPVVKEQTIRIQAGWTKAVQQLAATRTEPLEIALAQAEGTFGATIRAAGFSAFDPKTAATVAQQARRRQHLVRVEQMLEQAPVKSVVAAYLNMVPAELKTPMVWRMLEKPKAAAWLLEQMKITCRLDTGDLTTERIVELARHKAETAALDKVLQRTIEMDRGFLGVGTRLGWLILVSLLVCAIGISNAMLMNVTERFREIATLKCLGSLDGFIMMLFVMEACLFGLVGGLAGGLIGSLIGFGRMAVAFGGLFFSAFPWLSWLIAMLLSLVVGVALAAVAGLYPSSIAARLAPMEAMRIE